ncbi:NUDIX hydrolase [Mycobacterium malmoense]|uniref:DNA mismatch repair protein MutT n=1 Tax=Mycobacterium malmoense TaxID=1780 RepID=A0ABX3T087_MYCMA|nr:NUDIX hydrolase [Mycobacterium malmoense]ORA85458.1 DNA mismatch repair protein MutT [Mycobacterium malmoense]QZA17823.1 NUDIX hydrolase [Mycobacterium malmoense]UNB94600.1 NUDIX hydrolase [Mycobacterium malmoense]
MSEFNAEPTQSGRQGQRPRQGGARRTDTASQRLPTVREFSAGGLVVHGIDCDQQFGVIIGRDDRRGRTLWSLPKGHIEIGERPEQTAVREIAEETGIRGDVLAALGSVEYWFRADDTMVHKTVHHYLLRFREGEPIAANDHEVTDVAWMPLEALPSRLAHADERRVTKVAADLIHALREHGPAALPPIPAISPRRRPQRHSIATHGASPPKPRPGRQR